MSAKHSSLLDEARRRLCVSPFKVTNPEDGTPIEVRCMSRDPRICQGCADLNRYYNKRLIGSGCNVSEADSITSEMLIGYEFYFVTLTAPSFGKVHTVPSRETSPRRVCSCGQTHDFGDPRKGTPVDWKRYRYFDQVDWNRASSELFKRTTKYLADDLPDAEWCAAMEWQVRGSIHAHLIVRVPASLDQGQVVRSLRRMREYKLGSYVWGREIDVQRLSTEGRENAVRYQSKVVSYTAKWQSQRVESMDLARMDVLLSKHAARLKCSRQGCSKGCTGRMHAAKGYSGHLLKMSSGWSLVGLTRQRLNEERRLFAASASQESSEIHREAQRLVLEVEPEVIRMSPRRIQQDLLDFWFPQA